MGGCTAYVKCCMCDDSVGHKHAIRKFDEAITSCLENNHGKAQTLVINIDDRAIVKMVSIEEALKNLKITERLTNLEGQNTQFLVASADQKKEIKDLKTKSQQQETDITVFKQANETLKGRFLS